MSDEDDIMATPMDAGFATLICNSCGLAMTAMMGPGLNGYEFGEAVLAVAREHGWVRVGIMDYCPLCSPVKASTN